MFYKELTIETGEGQIEKKGKGLVRMLWLLPAIPENAS